MQHFTTKIFKASVLKPTTLEPSEIGKKIWQSTAMIFFNNSLIKIGRPTTKRIYKIFETNSMYLTILILIHLNKDKFNQNRTDC